MLPLYLRTNHTFVSLRPFKRFLRRTHTRTQAMSETSKKKQKKVKQIRTYPDAARVCELLTAYGSVPSSIAPSPSLANQRILLCSP